MDRNEQAVEVTSWQQIVFEPGFSFKLVRYTTGTPVPEGAVVGGQLADGTPLYVAVALSQHMLRPIGYYNPVTQKINFYWIIVLIQGGDINILVNV